MQTISTNLRITAILKIKVPTDTKLKFVMNNHHLIPGLYTFTHVCKL